MSLTQAPCKSIPFLLNQSNEDTNIHSKISLHVPSKLQLSISPHSNKSSLSTQSSSRSSDMNLTDHSHSVSTRTTTPAPTIANCTTIHHDANALQFVQKRVLFVSIIQLSRTYRNIPSFILENAVFAFGIKRSWIFPDSEKQIIEAKTNEFHHFVSNWSQPFIEIIEKKDEKGHILWMKPCNKGNEEQYWSTISNKLCRITDLSVSKITSVSRIDTCTEIENKSRASTSNILHKETAWSPFSISEQILSPTTCRDEFTFTNYSDDEDDDDDVDTDTDFDKEEKTQQKPYGLCTQLTARDVFEIKSRPSKRDVFDSEYYLPLKLDINWWLKQYESSCSMFNIGAQDIIKQIESMDDMDELQFNALKELFYQSNRTLIPMECFDFKVYIDAHLQNENKYNHVLMYCNQHCFNPKHKDKDEAMDSAEFAVIASHSERSTSMLSAESNSLLPFRGKYWCDGSQSIQLFDSKSDNRCNKTDEKENEELDHLEYYLSNTIVSCSRKDECSDVSNDNDKKMDKKKHKSIKSKHKNVKWKYEVPSRSMYRAKGNILISREMTNTIIRNRIKENISNLWQFMDKNSVILKDIFYTKSIENNNNNNIGIRVVYHEFHDKVSNDKLYCVLDENKDKMKTNYGWKMRDRLWSAMEIESEFEIKSNKLPISVREQSEWQSYVGNEDKIRNIMLNEDKMRIVMNKTKWHKLAIQNKQHSKRRMTLSMNKEEFMKHLHCNIMQRRARNGLDLVPIVMFKDNEYRMEYLWMIEIDVNINIGISIVYLDETDDIEMCSIHLDKTYICNQYELVSCGFNRLQCLEHFESSITNLHIGNPDDLMNRIKDLQKRNNDLKSDNNTLNQELSKINKKYQQLIAKSNDK